MKSPRRSRESVFVEVTPVQVTHTHNVVVTVRLSGADRIYIACGYTDLRCGINGLASLVQQRLQLDPFSNTLFLFCGRRRDRIKALCWEGDGFALLYKRLESGSFQWSRKESEAKIIRNRKSAVGAFI